METKKKWFTLSNLFTALIAIFLLAVIFNPDLKSEVLQGLMKVGLFQPDVPEAGADTLNSESSSTETRTGPEISFRDEKGSLVHLSSLKGKVVFINFWATWCPPCIAEMPSINTLSANLKTNPNVVILMVDVDSNTEKSMEFMQKNKYNLPVFSPASALPPEFQSNAIPTTVVLDKAGNIVFRHEGGADYSNPEFLAYLEKISKS